MKRQDDDKSPSDRRTERLAVPDPAEPEDPVSMLPRDADGSAVRGVVMAGFAMSAAGIRTAATFRTIEERDGLAHEVDGAGMASPIFGAAVADGRAGLHIHRELVIEYATQRDLDAAELEVQRLSSGAQRRMAAKYRRPASAIRASDLRMALNPAAARRVVEQFQGTMVVQDPRDARVVKPVQMPGDGRINSISSAIRRAEVGL